MKEESKNIKLELGDVSLNKELGIYYIDMSPAIIHYKSNLYGGGFDENGVPMDKSIDGTIFYFPINIAQYGFILHAHYLKNKCEKTLITLKSCVNKLEELKTTKDNYCVWLHKQYNYRYNIKPPWPSAMAQGELISLYLRAYQLFENESYLDTAKKAYKFLELDVEEGGVKKIDENGYLWYEEYPSKPSSYVLNGFIYTIFGLYDLFRITNNKSVKKNIDLCINTLKNNIHKYDAGFWSRYDLLKKELVRYYYQKNVHVPQLEILYKLTNEPLFLNYKQKWENNLSSINYLFVKFMYRIEFRFNKLKNFWIRDE